MTSQGLTLTTLVSGARANTREIAITQRIDYQLHTAVILEGLPDGHGQLQQSADQPLLKVIRIAPGCMHCIGNLVMRVTLNRILRTRPQRLFIGVNSDEHIAQLRQFLSAAPYDLLLSLTADVTASS